MEDQRVHLWQQHKWLYNMFCETYHSNTDKEMSWTEVATAVTRLARLASR